MTSEPTAAENKIVVHYLSDSRSQRIVWLLEELEVSYEIKRYERLPSLLAPPELKKVHPLGKSPVITDGDVTVAESGAIVEYLIKKYGQCKIQSLDGQQWLDDVYYSHFAEGTIMPHLVFYRIVSVMPSRTPFLIRPIAKQIAASLVNAIVYPNVKREIALVASQFQKHPGGWIAGGETPTAADFMMLFPLEIIGGRIAIDIPQSIKDYIKRVHERPAYKRALEKVGPYRYGHAYETE